MVLYLLILSLFLPLGLRTTLLFSLALQTQRNKKQKPFHLPVRRRRTNPANCQLLLLPLAVCLMTKMTKHSPSDHLLLYSCIFVIVSALVTSADATSLDRQELLNTWMPMKAAASCRGSIGECLDGGSGELSMDSEMSRRILATRNYISYAALQRNTIPCSRRGASYYNCQPGAEANPYTRGCSTITRCRS